MRYFRDFRKNNFSGISVFLVKIPRGHVLHGKIVQLTNDVKIHQKGQNLST